ncbi:MAG TPA: hypothetical protein VL625_06070 [Patescibacteria group bacterium]|nr:hypothetical protein [Patescibacteria group bacterium]
MLAIPPSEDLTDQFDAQVKLDQFRSRIFTVGDHSVWRHAYRNSFGGNLNRWQVVTYDQDHSPKKFRSGPQREEHGSDFHFIDAVDLVKAFDDEMRAQRHPELDHNEQWSYFGNLVPAQGIVFDEAGQAQMVQITPHENRAVAKPQL